MLRFVPDTWLDGLLRPALLADPVAGLYSEIQAPDWRFLLLALATIGVLLARRRASVPPAGWGCLVGLTAAFYLWTWVSGNGRYFLWGLLLAGPLLVMMVSRLPATRAMRNTLIVLALALQVFSLRLTFEPNLWALRPWRAASDATVAPNRFQREPAVLLTIGAISHSILVPHFHPQSRWSNLAGQQADGGTSPIEARWLQALLDDPLPKYAVVRANFLVLAADSQPIAAARAVITRALGAHGLRPASDRCEFVASAMAGFEHRVEGQRPVASGFLFCPVERAAQVVEAEPRHAPELDDVFARVESTCPRLLPTGNARTRPFDEGFVRSYNQSDTSVFINHAGVVYFKNMRALNPTVLGKVEEIRAGRFVLDCSRLPGRYVPPWARS